jgi:hypothetical protein
MKTFLQRHGSKILGVLSGFDRMRFRGSLRMLCNVRGMASWLNSAGVLLKDFPAFAEKQTKRLRSSVEAYAQAAGRRVIYLEGKVDKEDLVRGIRDEQSPAENGLIAVLSTVETCRSFKTWRNRDTQRLELRSRVRKCLHYYFYFEDGRFGLSQVRLMTFFPFDVHVVLNGREWLARELDKTGIGYLRRDNCFMNIDDFARAQKLADQQPRIDWLGQLERLLRRVYPQPGQFGPTPQPVEPQSYYWSGEETEWATDLAFRDPAELAELYPSLIRHGIQTFQSPDVMRFLGHKVPAHGGVNGKYAGEIVSDLKRRPEGVRLKHRARSNSIKMYDKFARVLRIETTLNSPRGLKVYRRKQDDSKGPKQWLPLRKSVADLARRAKLSQSANERYLEALGRVETDAPLSSLTDKLCQPITIDNRRYRALRPFDPEEVRLLEIVSRGEYEIAGFRNRDVRVALYGSSKDEDAAERVVERRRQAGRISRKLSMLRAHGLIKKIPRTHRYLLTTAGRTAIAAILAARQATPRQLTAA